MDKPSTENEFLAKHNLTSNAQSVSSKTFTVSKVIFVLCKVFPATTQY